MIGPACLVGGHHWGYVVYVIQGFCHFRISLWMSTSPPLPVIKYMMNVLRGEAIIEQKVRRGTTRERLVVWSDAKLNLTNSLLCRLLIISGQTQDSQRSLSLLLVYFFDNDGGMIGCGLGIAGAGMCDSQVHENLWYHRSYRNPPLSITTKHNSLCGFHNQIRVMLFHDLLMST